MSDGLYSFFRGFKWFELRHYLMKMQDEGKTPRSDTSAEDKNKFLGGDTVESLREIEDKRSAGIVILDICPPTSSEEASFDPRGK